MKYDFDKIDDCALALLTIPLNEKRRAWKGFDFDVLDRLHAKGWIDNPVGKTKSIVFTDEGLARAKVLFDQFFAIDDHGC